MNYKVYGFITILMHFAGLAIGFAAILPFSTLHAVIYSILVVVTTLAVVYSFCSKCPCHEKQCSHVILGPITRILPRRKIGKYKTADYWGLGVSFFTPAVYQSYWIWKHAVLPYVFYILFAATIALILLKVRNAKTSTVPSIAINAIRSIAGRSTENPLPRKMKFLPFYNPSPCSP